ncbi:MAG TPA: DUF3857 domain-containing protein [Bacteroidia bacterium]|nr:DUF3857 domain-containing protein [Bacteroidia bacterium]
MFSKKYIFLLIGLVALHTVFAQATSGSADPEYKNYHWEENPKLHDLSPAEQKMGMVVIKDKRIVEYSLQNGDVAMYITRHMIIRVNSDKAIEEANTVYIPMPDGVVLKDIEARAIAKDGKVSTLNSSNIKDVDNYENMGRYKIFAIDGIEMGGEVEFMYTLMEPSRKSGTEYIRMNSLVKDVRVDIYSPPALVFDTKSYNGFPDMITDTVSVAKRHIYCEGTNIRGYDKEEFSLEDGALMRMEYKYAYNANGDPGERLDTWSDFCQSIYQVFDKGITKKDISIAKKVIDTMKLSNLAEEVKIRNIESMVKTTISLKEDITDKNANTLEAILKNHVADELGLLKLYDQLFNSAGIKHEIVLTTNRFDKPFDGDFDSWTYLQKYMIYFPETGNYMAPMEPMSRYGFIPADWICQKGLFMHPVTIGKDFNTGIGQVRDIYCNDWKQSMNDLYEYTKFDLDMGLANIHLKQTYTGYESYDLQPIYSYLAEQDKKDLINRLMQYYFPDAKPTNINVTGYHENELFRQPFIIEADITTNSVLEQAGNKFLFKIGDLIGAQSQLYDDTTRHTAVENHYNHGYHRELEFEIPDGYTVTNMKAVNMDVFHETGGERDMEFHSYYKTDGNKVTVIIDEDYHEIRYPISMYEEFRRVINASADFNKVVLFIEKKSSP